MERYNICGVPESSWSEGKCACDHSVCEMTEDVIVEGRVYDYARKHELTRGSIFCRRDILLKMSKKKYHRKTPKYFRNAIAEEGLTMRAMEDFQRNQRYFVVRDSNDGTFQIGDVVWRDNLREDGQERLVSGNVDLSLLSGELEQALEGAMFEESVGGY